MTETIKFKGVEFLVEFDYQPEEPMVMYYPDGSGYPGCPEEIQITKIEHQGTDFFELLEGEFEAIEELISEKIRE